MSDTFNTIEQWYENGGCNGRQRSDDSTLIVNADWNALHFRGLGPRLASFSARWDAQADANAGLIGFSISQTQADGGAHHTCNGPIHPSTFLSASMMRDYGWSGLQRTGFLIGDTFIETSDGIIEDQDWHTYSLDVVFSGEACGKPQPAKIQAQPPVKTKPPRVSSWPPVARIAAPSKKTAWFAAGATMAKARPPSIPIWDKPKP